MIYNIGQMVTLNKDRELHGELSENTKIKKKGTKLFVGAGSVPELHYLNGDVELLSKDTKIEGFSAKGLAEWLYVWLSNEFEIDEMLDDYENSPEDFKERIVEALEELGFYDHTGNIS